MPCNTEKINAVRAAKEALENLDKSAMSPREYQAWREEYEQLITELARLNEWEREHPHTQVRNADGSYLIVFHDTAEDAVAFRQTHPIVKAREIIDQDRDRRWVRSKKRGTKDTDK